MNEETELEKVAAQYREGGYEVILHPGRADLPEFLRGFQPDLIARAGGESVVVEVKAKDDLSADHQLGYLSSLVNSQPGWRFDLVLIDPRVWPDEVPRGSVERVSSEIESLVRSAERLITLGELESAVLTAWAAVEAAMREVARRQAIPLERKYPQLLLKALYSEGVLSRAEYEQLREAMKIRNAIAHGLKTAQLGPKTPKHLIDTVTRLLDFGLSRDNA